MEAVRRGRQPYLVLASRSPRRVEILRERGFDFRIDPADVDEDQIPEGLTPEQVAMVLARRKADAVAARHPGGCVLGADTVVAVGATLYGKAETPEEARRMLRQLSGTTQRVLTGVAVIWKAGGIRHIDFAESLVEMDPFTDQQLEAYIASDQWRGKAGAYGIQDNDPLVRIVSGSFSNVVGLPIERVVPMLDACSVRPTTSPGLP
jgi:septum formation protein